MVILNGGVAQLVRAPACHAGGRGFEPLHSRHSKTASAVFFLYVKGLSPNGSRPIPTSIRSALSLELIVSHWFTQKNSSPNCFSLRTHSRHSFHKTLLPKEFFLPFFLAFFPSRHYCPSPIPTSAHLWLPPCFAVFHCFTLKNSSPNCFSLRSDKDILPLLYL